MAITLQPLWRRIASLGDVSPLMYGGFFVYEDRRHVYVPEWEIIAPHGYGWIVWRGSIEPHTYINGVLSDNPFHPELPAWYADNPNVDAVLRATLCSVDTITRALAYQELITLYGAHEFDSYPQTYTTRAALPRRFRRGK